MPYSRLLIPERRWRHFSRRWRLWRAVYRNLLVFWREFRTPIVVFVAAVCVGGWIYGELWARAGYGRLPYIDLPYTMLALMIFESPVDLPPEPELVAFWYLMPVVAAYVAGRGFFEVVRLFFNPNARRHSWEEAVASTYRRHVIVLGIGHLGLRVVRSLTQMGVEVVAIDWKADNEKLAELKRLGVPVVNGDGRLPATLETAGMRQAEALAVCTSNDYMNLEVTMRARDLNPDIRIVVRMWEDRFAAQIRQFMNVEAVLSATDLAAPSFAAAALGVEITQTMQVNGIDYSMIRLSVGAGSFMDGATVGQLQQTYEMDIVLHSHGDSVRVHPPHDQLLSAGDTVVIFAQNRRVIEVIARNQHRAPRAAG